MLYADVFGPWAPDSDVDFAGKFCLDAIARDHRLGSLARLLSNDAVLGSVEGDPGFSFERRRAHTPAAYAGWPADAEWRAYVDPAVMPNAHPERFYTRAEMAALIAPLAQAYARAEPDHAQEAQAVLDRLDQSVPAGR